MGAERVTSLPQELGISREIDGALTLSSEHCAIAVDRRRSHRLSTLRRAEDTGPETKEDARWSRPWHRTPQVRRRPEVGSSERAIPTGELEGPRPTRVCGNEVDGYWGIVAQECGSAQLYKGLVVRGSQQLSGAIARLLGERTPKVRI